MRVLVDTSVWSLALRRDTPSDAPEVAWLARAILAGETVVTTGVVLQEILQGVQGPKARSRILDRFALLPYLSPTRDDHIEAAELRNRCRRRGVQVGTIDALLAQLCIAYDLEMLTTDRDFEGMARVGGLRVVQAP